MGAIGIIVLVIIILIVLAAGIGGGVYVYKKRQATVVSLIKEIKQWSGTYKSLSLILVIDQFSDDNRMRMNLKVNGESVIFNNLRWIANEDGSITVTSINIPPGDPSYNATSQNLTAPWTISRVDNNSMKIYYKDAMGVNEFIVSRM